MNYKYTKDPLQYAAFFIAENKITHPEYEYIIHLAEPRCMIKYKLGQAYFAKYDEFYDNIAEVQWLDGTAPDKYAQEKLLVNAWNYLAIEERILEDDTEAMDDDEF
jgi:hypothetical protein